MRVQRLFEIVYLLAHRRTMTAAQLAEQFGVSTRTILRDIELLAGAGIPVYASRGYGGGIHLLDRYVLNKAVLSPAEQAEVLAGLGALTETSQDAAAALTRLSRLFALDETAWLEIDLSRWGAPADRATFAMLREAVSGRHAVTFDYASQYREARQLVYPLKLVYKSRAWYLQAARVDDEQYRTFKLTRMAGLVAHPQTPTPPHLAPRELELCRAEQPQPGSLPATMEPVTVQLKLSRAVRYRVLDEYEPDAVTALDDGYLVTLRIPIDAWLLGHVLSYGTDVEVLGPQSLRDEIAGIARAVAQRHARPAENLGAI